MKMTIRDVMTKLEDIDYAIKQAEEHMPTNAYTSAGPREAVIDLLEEYAEMIRNTKVDI